MGNIKVKTRWITGVGLVLLGLVLACVSTGGPGSSSEELITAVPTKLAPTAPMRSEEAPEAEASPLPPTPTEEAPKAEASPLPPTPTEAVIYIADEDPCITVRGDKGGGRGQEKFDIPAGKAVLKRLPGGYYAAYSPDGQTIVTIDFPDVYLWRADSYDLMHTLADDPYVYPSFSPDSKLLATKINDQTIRLWDVESGEPVEDIEISVDPDANPYSYGYLGAVQFSPNGDLIAVGVGRTIAIVDATSGNVIRLLTGKFLEIHQGLGNPVIENGPASPVKQLVFDNSGKVLFSNEQEGTVHLWEVETGRYLRCIHYSDNYDMALSPDGRTIAVAVYDGIQFNDATNGEFLSTWKLPTTGYIRRNFSSVGLYINSIAYSGDGRTIMVGLDRTVRIYDALMRDLIGLLHHPDLVLSVNANKKSDRIITGVGGDKGLNEAWIWDANHADVSLAATVQNWLENGISKALGGDIDGAKVLFEQAQSSNPFPGHDLYLEGLERITLAFIDQAIERAVAGDSRQALELIDRALEVNPHPEVDLRTLAIRYLVYEICVQVGRDLTQEEYELYQPENPSADTCWRD